MTYWTSEETLILEEGYNDELSISEISSKLPNRTQKSIVGRASRLRLRRRDTWTEEEISILEAAYSKRLARTKIKKLLPNRSIYAIENQVRRQRLAYRFPWTEEELRILKTGYAMGTSVQEIADQLSERTVSGVQNMTRRLELIHPNRGKELPELIDLDESHMVRVHRTLIEVVGNKCVHCGEANLNFLTIDHIHDNGSDEIEYFGGNYKMYAYYLRNPNVASENLQVLCWNCNNIKDFECRGLDVDPLRLEAMEKLASDWNMKVACFVSGFNDLRAVQVDHINGHAEKRASVLWHEILRNSAYVNRKKYQLLSSNYNHYKSRGQLWSDLKEGQLQ